VPATRPARRESLKTQWVIAECAQGAPDQRLDLSLHRTSTPRKNKITIAVSTLGIVAAAAGVITVCTAGGAAESAASTRPAYSLTQAAPPAAASALSPRGVGSQLDAVTAVAAVKPAQSVKVKPAPAKATRKRRKARPLTPRQIARRMLRSFHWRRWQFKYLNLLWSRESSWNVYASNPYSGAYGIPQAVPGSKMASAGPNWTRSARTQIRWGLRYIREIYGSPLRAWQHEVATGWY
jgi:hypothetical protein